GAVATLRRLGITALRRLGIAALRRAVALRRLGIAALRRAVALRRLGIAALRRAVALGGVGADMEPARRQRLCIEGEALRGGGLAVLFHGGVVGLGVPGDDPLFPSTHGVEA